MLKQPGTAPSLNSVKYTNFLENLLRLGQLQKVLAQLTKTRAKNEGIESTMKAESFGHEVHLQQSTPVCLWRNT